MLTAFWVTGLFGHLGINLISPEISPDFLKICADFLKDFQRFSSAFPLVSSSLRSLQASFAALSSEDGDLPESEIC